MGIQVDKIPFVYLDYKSTAISSAGQKYNYCRPMGVGEEETHTLLTFQKRLYTLKLKTNILCPFIFGFRFPKKKYL